MKLARNIAIVLALGVAVWLLPGGGLAANMLAWLVGVLFLGGMAFFAARLYRENRVAILALGDRNRGLLYGAVAVAVLTVTATPQLWDTPAGVLVWFVLIGAASYAVFAVYRSSQTY